jgi:FkbM family methyltransferase
MTIPTWSVLMNGRWHISVPQYRAFRWLNGDHERERLASMFLNIEDTDHVVDVGAEDGDMSCLLSTWVSQGGVSLVEPSPQSWPAIRATFEANDRPPPRVAWQGFASVGGVDPYKRYPHRIANDGWPMASEDEFGGEHEMSFLDLASSQGSVRLDDLLDEPVHVLNVDVEGAEIFVLEGARVLIETSRPLVWVSIHPHLIKKRYDYKPMDVVRMMEHMNYRATHLADDHESHWMFEPCA